MAKCSGCGKSIDDPYTLCTDCGNNELEKLLKMSARQDDHEEKKK